MIHSTHGAHSANTFFHIGVVVTDLADAIEKYSRVLGVTFTKPATFHVPRLEDPEPHPHDVVAVFSQEGPPYYELLQASGDGVFSAKFANQILYLGVWEHDMVARIAQLKADGIGLEAQFKDSEGNPFAIVTKPDVLGIRIEYVGDGAKGAIEEWVKTGEFTGEVAH